VLFRERADKLLHLIGGLLLGAMVLASCGTADSPTAEQSSAPTTEQSSAPTTASAAETMNAWKAWDASPTGQCFQRITTYTLRIIGAVYQESLESPEAVHAAAQSELVHEEFLLYVDVAGTALSAGLDAATDRAIEEGCVKLYGGTTLNDALQEPTTTTLTAPPEPDHGAVPEDEPGENEPDKVLSKVEWCKFFNTAYRKNSSGERDQQGLNQIIRFFDSEDGLRRGEANLGGRLQLLVDRASPPFGVAADVDAESNGVKQIARICGGS
jgi:hypothetical protein